MVHRTQLQELRDKFSAVEKVPEFVDIAAKARSICAAARQGAARHAHQQQVRGRDAGDNLHEVRPENPYTISQPSYTHHQQQQQQQAVAL
jgi:hypothetical protein